MSFRIAPCICGTDVRPWMGTDAETTIKCRACGNYMKGADAAQVRNEWNLLCARKRPYVEPKPPKSRRDLVPSLGRVLVFVVNNYPITESEETWHKDYAYISVGRSWEGVLLELWARKLIVTDEDGRWIPTAEGVRRYGEEIK